MKKVFWEGKWHRVTDEGLVAAEAAEPGIDDTTLDAAQLVPAKLKYNQSCPACGFALQYEENKRCARCKLTFARLDLEFTPPPPKPAPPPGTHEYKVITQRDEFFESKFDPAKLQEALNSFAADGWRVIGMTATDVGSFWGSFWSKGGGSSRQELIVLLEKVW